MSELYTWCENGNSEVAVLSEKNMYTLKDTCEELLKEFYQEENPSSEYVDTLMSSLADYLGVYDYKKRSINI